MFDPLNVNQRRRLLRWSIATSTTALLLVPLAALPGPAFDENSGRLAAPQVPAIPERLAYPALTVRHDPFGRPTPPPATLGDDSEMVLPPNDGLLAVPIVRAVLLGASPKALVELDGRTRIVEIGTRLGGTTIAAINAEGITLDDGERVPIDAGRR